MNKNTVLIVCQKHICASSLIACMRNAYVYAVMVNYFSSPLSSIRMVSKTCCVLMVCDATSDTAMCVTQGTIHSIGQNTILYNSPLASAGDEYHNAEYHKFAGLSQCLCWTARVCNSMTVNTLGHCVVIRSRQFVVCILPRQSIHLVIVSSSSPCPNGSR